MSNTIYFPKLAETLGILDHPMIDDGWFDIPEDAEFSRWSGYIPDKEHQKMITEKARIVCTGKKRPEHSEHMKKLYAEGKLKPPVGKAKGKRTGQALENIRAGVRKRLNRE